MTKLFLFLPLAVLFTDAAHAAAKVSWPSRNSEIFCGGSMDDEDLDIRAITPETLRAESKDGRILAYVDLHKPGQVRWLISDAMTDEEFEKREAILVKLSPAEADLIRKLSIGKQTDLNAGLTEGYVHLRTQFGSRYYTLSCQEVSSQK